MRALTGSDIKKFLDNVDENHVKLYTRRGLPEEIINSGLIHRDVAARSTFYSVACSGAPHESKKFVYICAHRNDRDKRSGEALVDSDPFCFVFDLDTSSPSPSGLITYHGTFEGRTLSEHDFSNHVIKLLDGGDEVSFSFDSGLECFTNAMHFVASEYSNVFGK